MANEINFIIKISSDGGQTFRDLQLQAQNADEAIERICESAREATDNIRRMAEQNINFGTIVQGLHSMNDAFQGLIGGYEGFDQSMRAANTMAGKGGEEFEALKDSVSSLAQAIPLAREELAGGLYQVISNGVPEDNWISFLEQSSKAAVGGIADLGQAVTVTSTIIKNYGLEWEEAGAIQDKIQMTAKNGVTSFEQLASALPRVSGSASQLGVSIDELMAVFASCTGVTGNTAEVSTQLAAVFASLIKPSSEAARAAEAMGISFNAASIKEAGGLENFLHALDTAIGEYSARTGELKEAVYGNLFGSAEALRVLTSLTGEQSGIFSRNIRTMAESSGAVDVAFGQMSSSGEATTRMLKNQIAAFTDHISAVLASSAPYVNLAANLGIASTTGVSLYKTLSNLAAGFRVKAAAIRLDTGALAVNRMAMAAMSGVMRVHRTLLAGLTVATGSLTVATVALTAVYTMGLSLAVAGIAALLSSLGDSAEEAAGKEDLLRQSAETFTATVAQVKGEIDMEIAALSRLIREQGDATEKVEELNRKYGDALGFHKTAAEWYDILISKSKAYCQALGYESQAKVLASQKAAKELELEEVRRRKKAMEESGEDKTTALRTHTYYDTAGNKNVGLRRETVHTKAYGVLVEQEVALSGETKKLQEQFDTCVGKMQEGMEELKVSAQVTGSVSVAVDVMAMSYAELSTAIEENEKKLKKLAPSETAEIKRLSEYNRRLEERKTVLGKQLGLGTEKSKGQGKDKTPVANPQSYEELGTAIQYYEKKLKATRPSEQESITLLTKKVHAYKEQQQAVARQLAEAGRPEELDSLEAIDRELDYQKNLRLRCKKENLAGIDTEITRLNTLRTVFEEQSHTVKSIGEIKTYQELSTEVAFYEKKLKNATQTERVEIKEQLNQLEQLRSAWDEQLASLKRPDDLSRLDTIGKLEEAIGYYETAQKKQSAQEMMDTQRTINALKEKRAALERLTEIPQMQQEILRMDGLGKKELKLELQLIGLEGVRKKIRDLQKMLADTRNPLDAGQRKEVEKLISSYGDYEKVLKKSSFQVGEAWSSIKGIGNGVQSLSAALEGNGNAWNKIVGIVDGVLQLYEGFHSVISVIQLLTSVSAAHATVKTVEAAAETTEAGTNAAAATAAVTASVATSAALNAETSAWSALAAAKTFAAHAYIPFVGTAIAAGFVATQQALIAAAAIPKFADGGLAYGPTLGIFGEYAGAANNPEVVAPLDKLKYLIGQEGNGWGGKVEFNIRGRYLRGVLERENKIRRRS